MIDVPLVPLQFAQLPAPNDPLSVGWVVLTVAGLLAIAGTVVGIMVGIKKLRASEPPEIRIKTDWATKQDVERVEDLVRDVDEHAKVGMREIDEHSRARRNESARETAELRTRIDAHDKMLGDRLSTITTDMGQLAEGIKDIQRVDRESRERKIDSDAQIRELRTVFKDELRVITHTAEERMVKVHDRINDVLKAVCTIEGHISGRFQGNHSSNQPHH